MAAALHRGLPIFDLGLGLSHGRGRVVIVLLADGFFTHQFPAAFRLQLERGQIGLGLAQRRLGRVQGHLKGRRVNLVEQLSGLDVGAFPELPLFDNAVDLRADFRHQVG